MKNIRFHKTLNEYKSFIFSEIAELDIFKYHPFYRGLIDFVIDHRSPLFFEASEEYEYAHFSQYFNFVLMRGYENKFVKDMFFMHDFLHTVFDNPVNIGDYSFEFFAEITTLNEYVASNDTETLTYYRLPLMREKSFSYPILFDLLKEKYPLAPDTRTLLDLRKKIIREDDDAGFEGEKATTVFAFLRKFKHLTPYWTKVWYDNFPHIQSHYSERRIILPINDYEKTLELYKSEHSEKRYQQNILLNIQIAFEILGLSNIPTTFDECEEAVKELENQILLKEAAILFHKQYISYKK